MMHFILWFGLLFLVIKYSAGRTRKVLLVLFILGTLVVLAGCSPAQAQQTPSVLDQKIACANVVKEKNHGVLVVKSKDGTDKVSSRFDPKTSTCFQIEETTTKDVKARPDGKKYGSYWIEITDAVEGTKYAHFISAWEETSTSAFESHPGGWFGTDLNGKFFSSTLLKSEKRTVSDFVDLVLEKFGIKL